MKISNPFYRIVLYIALFACCFIQYAFSYQVGTGIYDMTGPAVEINFMGYAVPSQRGSGIHLRLRSRAYVIGDSDKRIAFVSVDGGMASDLVKMKVVDYLNNALGESIYTTENIAISGTHTHSGPAGFLQYVLFQMTSIGFVKETFDAWVTGISESILMAHRNLQSGNIYVNEGLLYDSNINRSPTSYLLNPQEERDAYKEGDTDKNMLLLKMVAGSDSSGTTLGVLNWFAVHGTSMNNTNTLISGDNRGYASYSLEKYMNGESSVAGMGPFVAAFASTNLGDVSPNTAGAKCIDTGLPCDGTSSTCNGRCENCIAFGPGTNGDMFESTQIIGSKQYEFAKTLMESAVDTLSGTVDYRHSFVDMPNLNVTLSNGKRSKKLCTPAMGYSFAAGTTDGPGMFDFSQGTTTGNPFWNKVRDFLSEPTNEEKACQHPKPILLNTGDIDVPYQWDPHVVPVQILRVGNLFILSAPAEFTTMAGRRLRKTITNKIMESNMISSDEKIYVTIAGLTNSYASYVTTYEEYQAQRYEAASTIYGPHTLEGYIQEFSRLIDDMIAGRASDPGPSPPDLTDVQIQLIPDPIFDSVPRNHSFGEVVDGHDVEATYVAGSTASVKFYSANPRNNQKIQGTYLTIEKQRKLGIGYDVIATDGDWETKFHWQGGIKDPLDFAILPYSTATVTWDIPTTQASGTYRICHSGDHKMIKTGTIIPFQGCSSTFTVTSM